MFSADKLKKGCTAVIRELKCSGVLHTRLCDLGAVPGTEIELSGAAPFPREQKSPKTEVFGEKCRIRIIVPPLLRGVRRRRG